MDSTLKSNISVGLPLDLLVYNNEDLAVTRFVTIDEQNQYFQMIRRSWGSQLKRVFEAIDDPVWDAPPEDTLNVLSSAADISEPVRVPPPNGVARGVQTVPRQILAEQDGKLGQAG
jgi:putative proteasome-type protease